MSSEAMDYVEPTDVERRAVREYCIAKSSISRDSEPFQSLKRDLSKTKQQKRDEIFNYMIDHDLVCCQLPGETPSFVRIKSYANQASLSPELIADAVDEMDEPPREGEALSTILQAVKEKRVVRGQYALIGKSPPKGESLDEITIADESLSALCVEYLEIEKKLSEATKEMKDKLQPKTDEAKAHEEVVSAFMTRANITSQRVNVLQDEGTTTQTYFIRRKRAEKKARITAPVLESLVQRSLQAIGGDLTMSSRSQFRDSVTEAFNQLPTETSERISMDRGVLKKRERE